MRLIGYLLLIVSIVFFLAAFSSVLESISARLDSLQSQIDTLNECLQHKANADDLKGLQDATEGIDIKIKEVNETMNGWDGLLETFFGPSQKAYMKRR